jgi:hypothetical protein
MDPSEKAVHAPQGSAPSEQPAATSASTPSIDREPAHDDAMTESIRQKTRRIEAACDGRVVAELIEISETPGGFLNDSLRRRACKNWLSCLESSPPGRSHANMAPRRRAVASRL